MPQTLDAGLQARIHTLWDELAGFEAAHTDAALVHLLTRVAGILGAQNAYWFGAVRVAESDADPLLGWRARCIRYLTPLPDDSTFTRDRIRSIEQGAVDEATVAQARLAGRYRANRLRDLVSPAWFESARYQGYMGRGVHDSLVVGAPVSPMATMVSSACAPTNRSRRASATSHSTRCAGSRGSIGRCCSRMAC
jgi:hypothetical protein